MRAMNQMRPMKPINPMRPMKKILKYTQYTFLHLTLGLLLVLLSACASSSKRYRRPPYAKGYFMQERGYIQPYPPPIAPLPPLSYEENHYFVPVTGRRVPTYNHNSPCNDPYPSGPSGPYPGPYSGY